MRELFSKLVIRFAGSICCILAVVWIVMFVSFYSLFSANPQVLDLFAVIWLLGAVLFMAMGVGLLYLIKHARIPFMIISGLAGGWFAFVIFAFSGEGGNVLINRLWALVVAVITGSLLMLFSSRWIKAGFNN